ncbi:hypothetical protein [Gordonia sp. DT101]|uniref:hypothetical protein n=1 Tax=Gordonia sp. DT101 TaxID=3416545 RepID=UPI003CF186EB
MTGKLSFDVTSTGSNVRCHTAQPGIRLPWRPWGAITVTVVGSVVTSACHHAAAAPASAAPGPACSTASRIRIRMSSVRSAARNTPRATRIHSPDRTRWRS